MKPNSAVVELGHTAINDLPSPRQKMRADKALEIFKTKNCDYIITTGGKGLFNKSDKPLGDIVREYLLTQSVSSDKILVDNISKDTVQNMIEVYKLCSTHNIKNLAIVTSFPHILRAKRIAKNLNVNNINLTFYTSDYSTGLYQTIWDAFWEVGGWIKLFFRGKLI